MWVKRFQETYGNERGCCKADVPGLSSLKIRFNRDSLSTMTGRFIILSVSIQRHTSTAFQTRTNHSVLQDDSEIHQPRHKGCGYTAQRIRLAPDISSRQHGLRSSYIAAPRLEAKPTKIEILHQWIQSLITFVCNEGPWKVLIAQLSTPGGMGTSQLFWLVTKDEKLRQLIEAAAAAAQAIPRKERNDGNTKAYTRALSVEAKNMVQYILGTKVRRKDNVPDSTC